MGRLLIVGFVAASILGATSVSQPAAAEDEECYVVRATADARNQNIARDRAERRLQTYIGRKLNAFTGKTISPIRTTCIRNACEAAAAFCRH